MSGTCFARRPRTDGNTSRCRRRISASIPKHCVAAFRRNSTSRAVVRAALQSSANLSAARTAARCKITISGLVSTVDRSRFFGFSAVARLVLVIGNPVTLSHDPIVTGRKRECCLRITIRPRAHRRSVLTGRLGVSTNDGESLSNATPRGGANFGSAST